MLHLAFLDCTEVICDEKNDVKICFNIFLKAQKVNTDTRLKSIGKKLNIFCLNSKFYLSINWCNIFSGLCIRRKVLLNLSWLIVERRYLSLKFNFKDAYIQQKENVIWRKTILKYWQGWFKCWYRYHTYLYRTLKGKNLWI